MIDDDPVKVGRLPPIRSSRVRVISSAEFLNRPAGGTLLLTGFGYVEWTRRLSEIAAGKGMSIYDPNDDVLEEPLKGANGA